MGGGWFGCCNRYELRDALDPRCMTPTLLRATTRFLKLHVALMRCVSAGAVVTRRFPHVRRVACRVHWLDPREAADQRDALVGRLVADDTIKGLPRELVSLIVAYSDPWQPPTYRLSRPLYFWWSGDAWREEDATLPRARALVGAYMSCSQGRHEVWRLPPTEAVSAPFPLALRMLKARRAQSRQDSRWSRRARDALNEAGLGGLIRWDEWANTGRPRLTATDGAEVAKWLELISPFVSAQLELRLERARQLFARIPSDSSVGFTLV